MVNLIDKENKKPRWEIAEDGTVQIWQRKKDQKTGLTATFAATNENFREQLREHRVGEKNAKSKTKAKQHEAMAGHIRKARDAWQLATGITKPSLGPKLRHEPTLREIAAQWAAMGYGWYGHP
jgi:hypothetical protein